METETAVVVNVTVERMVDTMVLAGSVVVRICVEPGAVVVNVLAGIVIVLRIVLTLVETTVVGTKDVCVGPEIVTGMLKVVGTTNVDVVVTGVPEIVVVLTTSDVLSDTEVEIDTETEVTVCVTGN